MDGAHGAQIARSSSEREELVKEWLVRLIDRASLAEVGEIPTGWIAREAPPLIADVVAVLADPTAAPDRVLQRGERERAARLAKLRTGAGAAEQIPRDLAALQALMIEAIRREIPERRPGDFARAVQRLAEIFGSIQGAVTTALVEERSGGAPLDKLTGLPGPVQLDEWMRILVAEQGRYEHPFAVALVDIEGLGRINDAYGEKAGDRMLAAIAGVIRAQVRGVDRAFRREGDEFCIIAPHQDAEHLLPMAERIAALVAESQTADGPRIAIAVGVASCPRDGETAKRVLESAEQATYAAKAEGRSVAIGPNSSRAVLQDR